jgi:hypothetical protein
MSPSHSIQEEKTPASQRREDRQNLSYLRRMIKGWDEGFGRGYSYGFDVGVCSAYETLCGTCMMHAHEMHTYETHAYEIHARDMHAVRHK